MVTGSMIRKIAVSLICVALVFSLAACGDSKKEKAEKEKAKREEIRKENEAAANAVVSSIESLPEEEDLTLKDATAVDGARSTYEELTDDQKALVPAEMKAKLENAEKKIAELTQAEEQRQLNMKEDKKAARQTEDVIDGIPDKVTLDAEGAVEQGRASYNQLTDDQKSYVKKSSVEKLTKAEKKIKKLKKEAEKKAAEEEKKAAEQARKDAEQRAEEEG